MSGEKMNEKIAIVIQRGLQRAIEALKAGKASRTSPAEVLQRTFCDADDDPIDVLTNWGEGGLDVPKAFPMIARDPDLGDELVAEVLERWDYGRGDWDLRQGEIDEYCGGLDRELNALIDLDADPCGYTS